MNFENAYEGLDSLLNMETRDEECQALRAKLGEVQTISELVAFTKEHFNAMFKHMRYMLTDYTLEYLPRDVCSAHGILINPERMPAPIDDIMEYVVIADGSVKTLQDTPDRVYYYGHVDLTISAGAAVVMDTCHPVTAKGNVRLIANGETVVNSTGPILLGLNERARATVEDAEEVQLANRTFLESKSGKPRIFADDQAQFVVSGGSATVTMNNGARGVILNKEHPNEQYKVEMKGSSLLFVENSEAKNCNVEQKGYSTFINGSATCIHAEMLLEAVAPWRERKADCLEAPMLDLETDTIRAKMEPFLPELDAHQREAWMQAVSGYKLCQQMRDWIPEMVEKGLTGELLRNTFSSSSLRNANIFTGENYISSLVFRDGPQYYFGDELVNGFDCKDPIYCFENALLLTDSKGVVGQSATVITTNNSEVEARGNAHAIIYGHSQMQASGQATVWASDDARVDAKGFATVYAANRAEVAGHDHAWIELLEQNKATAKDNCRVITVDKSTVETFDNAKVWHAAYASECQPTVIAHNGDAEVGRLASYEAFKALRNEWKEERDKPLQKSAGMHR